MKRQSILCTFAVLLSLLSAPCVHGQGTAFTYQGRLNSGSNPAEGLFDLRFAVYNSIIGSNITDGAITRSATAVSNGLFNVTLDFGPGVFNGAGRWLEIRVRTNGEASFSTLSPRQALTPAPYAITAGTITGTVPSGSLAGAYASAVNFNNVANQFSGDGSGLRFGGFGYTNLPSYWKLAGNAGTTPGINFVGTTDNQALELRVNRQRALRLEPSTNSPNLIGGFEGNYVEANVVGASIGGGGTVNATNRIVNGGDSFHGVFHYPAHFATIAGGVGNSISGNRYASIGGGANNLIDDSWGLGVDLATISGGSGNTVDMAPGSTIAGGVNNRIVGDNGDFVVESTIGGGSGNRIETLTDRIHQVTIGGGRSNSVYKATQATISGGRNNLIDAYADQSTVAGGGENRIGPLSSNGTISGGAKNAIGSVSQGVTISGGVSNAIGSHADGATIGGGTSNVVQSYAFHSTIGGGNGNQIQTPDGREVRHGTIAGGAGNIIWSAGHATIGGGSSNSIRLGSDGAFIGGGEQNFMDVYCRHSVIAGGASNFMGYYNSGSTISGGVGHFVPSDAAFSTIGGGAGNTSGSRQTWADTVGGGMGNASQSLFAGTIGGGTSNRIEYYSRNATISGGDGNVITGGVDSFPFPGVGGGAIGGGLGNSLGGNGWAAVISGGESNQANGPYSAVPGGRLNLADGTNSLAAGTRAKAVHSGAFVWAAGNTNDYPSFSENRVHFYATGGLEVEYGGQLPNGRGNKWIVLGSQAANRVISVYNGAYLSDGGAWTDTSDRNAKEKFEPVKPRDILNKVAALPLSKWSYRTETNGVRHLGPVAQDFHQLFGLGPDDKHIASLDSSGVALAAIQGLVERLKDKESEIDLLKRRLDLLERRWKQAGSNPGADGE